MDPKRFVIALIAGLVLAGGATYFVYYRVIKQMNAQTSTRKIVAAAHNLDAGAELKVDDLALIDWPIKLPLAGTFEKREDLKGRAVINSVAEKMPILQADLAAPGAGIALAAKIPPGMRATAIRNNEIIGVGGFLFPGSKVDVLATYRPLTGTPEPITQTILQNVDVLTTGPMIQPDPAGKPQTVNVVTLLLSPKDAEKMTLVATNATVQFVLRNGSDTEQTKMTPISWPELVGLPKPPTAKAVAIKKAVQKKVVAPPTYAIEVIRGDKRSVENIQQ